MLILEELKEDGRKFLDEYRCDELDDLAKMNANAYMRGLLDGGRLVLSRSAQKQELIGEKA